MHSLITTSRYGAIKSAFSPIIMDLLECGRSEPSADELAGALRERHYPWLGCVVVQTSTGGFAWNPDFRAAQRHRKALETTLRDPRSDDFAHRSRRQSLLGTVIPYLAQQGYSSEEMVAFVEGLFGLGTGIARRRLAEWTAEQARILDPSHGETR